MLLATFNVNSVRARLPVLVQWLESVQPDVVALQETKVEDDKFPRAEIEALGYHLAAYGQAKYNGVALLSKSPFDSVETGFGDAASQPDARVILARTRGLAVINTYVPNGTAVGSEKFLYKLSWFDRLNQYISSNFQPSDRVVWMGDINVAPTALDVFDPVKMEGQVCFHPDEKAALASCLQWGWTDCFRKVNQSGGEYSYWEYFLPNGFKRNLGWRIDHIYASEGLSPLCRSCTIDREPRGWERPSDHTPVLAEFEV